MPKLSQSEVNSIREIVTGHQMIQCKLSSYAKMCNDPQIKQMFEKASTEAGQSAQKLIQMI